MSHSASPTEGVNTPPSMILNECSAEDYVGQEPCPECVVAGYCMSGTD